QDEQGDVDRHQPPVARRGPARGGGEHRHVPDRVDQGEQGDEEVDRELRLAHATGLAQNLPERAAGALQPLEDPSCPFERGRLNGSGSAPTRPPPALPHAWRYAMPADPRLIVPLDV